MNSRSGLAAFCVAAHLLAVMAEAGGGRDAGRARRISGERHWQLRRLPFAAGAGRDAVGAGALRRRPTHRPAVHRLSAEPDPDPATRLGTWTEDQIVTRASRRADARRHRPAAADADRLLSRHLGPRCPCDRRLSAVAGAGPECGAGPHYDQPTLAGYGGPVGPVPDPDPADRVAYGRYLAQMGHCMLCHSPRDSSGRPGSQPDGGRRRGAGQRSRKIATLEHHPDPQTGIGAWTDQQVRDALTKGVRRTARAWRRRCRGPISPPCTATISTRSWPISAPSSRSPARRRDRGGPVGDGTHAASSGAVNAMFIALTLPDRS